MLRSVIPEIRQASVFPLLIIAAQGIHDRLFSRCSETEAAWQRAHGYSAPIRACPADSSASGYDAEGTLAAGPISMLPDGVG